jgi:superfamily II DNA or RNA helicase
MNLAAEQEKIRKIQAHYRSEKHNLRRDFFEPCLESFSRYRRAAGYFSSSALRTWAACLPRLAVESQIKIQLLISPELSKTDLASLRLATDDVERHKILQMSTDAFITKVLQFQSHADGKQEIELRVQLLAWLIAKGRLDLRFAINLYDEEEKGIFHKKIGVFEYPWGDWIAFTGSANESMMAHEINAESVDVYRSWIEAENPRVQTKVEEFEEAWNSKGKSLLVLPVSQTSLKLIKVVAPEKPPQLRQIRPITPVETDRNELWPHQKKAVKAFLKVGHGILEMATGTGKTRTALEIATCLRKAGKIEFMIVAMAGIDILNQWFEDLPGWALQNGFAKCYRHFGTHHERDNFLLTPAESILLCSRSALAVVFKELHQSQASTKALIIHDEVHDFGSPTCIATLTGAKDLFAYRLGLSATPEREYDQAGNKFVTTEIGLPVFKFGLRDAIEAKILCPLSYEWIPYSLTKSDKQDLARVFARAATLKKACTPWPKEKLWMELSRVYKRAKNKVPQFEKYLCKKPSGFLRRTLIFVEDKAFADTLYDIIHAKTHSYSAYYAEDEPDVLGRFIAGLLDCLITCHKLSQGIDIRSVQKIVLFSSARSKLETIQRLGRCLRIDPEQPAKVATVIDFVLVNAQGRPDPAGMDYARYKWIAALSNVRPK